jgi:hypothetical protein
MAHEFPAMPAFDPTGPGHDDIGFDMTISAEGVTLTRGEESFLIPSLSIQKFSAKILPGCDTQLNCLQLRIFGGKIIVTDDAWIDEIPVIREEPLARVIEA